MPCNTDHMEPTVKERQQMEAAKMLVYLHGCLGRPISDELRAAAHDIYGRGIHPDNVVRMLCDCFRTMTESEMSRYVYDGRSAAARRAADWWEEHQVEDAKRRDIERREELVRKYPNHVFIVFRNADMTEGRGPMILDSIYADLDRAITAVMSRSGVMGRKTKLEHHEERTTGGRVTSPETWSANDHDIQPVKVL